VRINNLRYRTADTLWKSFKKNPRVNQLISRGQHLTIKNAPEIELKLLTSAIPIDENTFPDIHKLFRFCCKKLQINKSTKVHFVASNDGLASAFISQNVAHVSLDSSLIGASKEMLKFVLGHELAHIKLGHCSKIIPAGKLSDLPESAVQQWYALKRSWEISADRLASLCCNSQSTAESAIVSLSFNNLIVPANFDGIIDSIETVKNLVSDNPWLKISDATHPDMAIRLASIRRFQSTCLESDVPMSNIDGALQETDKYVDELLCLYSPSEESVEHSLFVYSIFLLAIKHNKLSDLNQSLFEKYANKLEILRLRSLIRRKRNKTEYLLEKAKGLSKKLEELEEHLRVMWLMRINEVFSKPQVISYSTEDFIMLSKIWNIKKDLVSDCFN
jgi:hypothetical protein